MSIDTLNCPNCGSSIKLTESLAKPLIDATRQEFEKKIALKEAEAAKREDAMRAREAELAARAEAVDAVVSEKLGLERAAIAAEEAKRAQLFLRDEMAAQARELAAAKELAKDRDRKLTEAQREQADLMRQQRELSDAKRELELSVETKVEASLAAVREKAKLEAQHTLAFKVKEKDEELAAMQQALASNAEKLAAAQQMQADLMRKQRELDDEKREIALTIEKRVEESLVVVREKAKVEAETGLTLKLKEKDEQLSSMQRTIEELKRKGEQGSQQLQGEVLEMEIETRLKTHFPMDAFEAVPKGKHGGDILHRVIGPQGQDCGTILWETKRTKTWSNTWLTKLRDDQRAAKADVALIATMAMPSGIQTFDHVEGIWVASYHCIVPVAVALRHSLIELARERRRMAGQNSKMELVYEYLTGREFQQRVGAIVERFESMRADLVKERSFMERQWSAREKLLNGVLVATSGMYGDLQGIAGNEMPEIESLQPLQLPASTN